MIDNSDTKSHTEGSPTSLRFYNTLRHDLQEFVPLRSGEASLYCCGPTVYNYAHIGNLRTYIFEDTLRRSLELLGYRVRHVMNVTDIGHLSDDGDEGEDKIIRSAREQGRTVWDIAAYYSDIFFKDIDKLNILRPTVVCRASDHIDDMITLVRRIEERGYSYNAGGNVYFDTDKYDRYGELARLDRQQLKSGSRVEIDPNKRNPHDFVLWFTRSKFERQAMLWDSPWGRGYPGWHLECSAMSMRYLGEHFDIHCGGVDHIPVHHTNEIAQVEAVTGTTWVNYWLHAEFLVAQDTRMSKSGGTFITVADLERNGFEPLDMRYLCLNSHYRKQLQFSFDALGAARAARLKIHKHAHQLLCAESAPDGRAPRAALQEARAQFYSAVSDDLNMPRCLALLWQLLKRPHPATADEIELLKQIDGVLGLRLFDEPEGTDSVPAETVAWIESRMAERDSARARRDWKQADHVRNELVAAGILLEDRPDGTHWKRRQT